MTRPHILTNVFQLNDITNSSVCVLLLLSVSVFPFDSAAKGNICTACGTAVDVDVELACGTACGASVVVVVVVELKYFCIASCIPGCCNKANKSCIFCGVCGVAGVAGVSGVAGAALAGAASGVAGASCAGAAGVTCFGPV